MEADYDEYEVVYVIGGHKLVDSESYERRYWTPECEPLVPGYYVVHWPQEVRIRRFNSLALFHGPFKRRPDAESAMNMLRNAPAVEELALLHRSQEAAARRYRQAERAAAETGSAASGSGRSGESAAALFNNGRATQPAPIRATRERSPSG